MKRTKIKFDMNRWMRKMMATGVACVLLTGSVLPAVASNNADSNQVEEGVLTVAMNHIEEDMKKYVDKFEAQNPGITVKYECVNDYENEMTKRIQNNEEPDVYLIPYSMEKEDYVKELLPLGTKVELSSEYRYIEKGKIEDGVVYGIPSFAYLNGFIVNQRIFEEAGIMESPSSIPEFLEDMHLIQDHTDAIPFFTNYNTPWATTYWSVFPFVEMHGDDGYHYDRYLTDTNQFSENTSYYKVFRLLYDLIRSGYTEKIGQYSWDEGKMMLNTGEVACMACGSWGMNQVQDAGSEWQDISFMTFPNSIDGKKYVTVSVDYCYGINKNSQNVDAAKKFVEFMIQSSGYAAETGNISVYSSDPYPDYVQGIENVEFVSEALPTDEEQALLDALQTNVVPGSADEIIHLINVAAGIEAGSFDEVMQDWHNRWEEGRIYYVPASQKGSQEKDSSNVSISIDMENTQINLSQKEKNYIESQNTLKAGYILNAAPYSFEEEGKFSGLSYEMCEIIQEMTGLEMVYVPYNNPQEVINALKDGEIDLCAISQNYSYKGIRYSKEYFSFNNIIIYDRYTDLKDISKYTASVLEGSRDPNQVIIDNKIYSKNHKTCIEDILQGRSNYTIMDYYAGVYYLRDLDAKELNMTANSGSGTLHIAFREDENESLVAIVNKCIINTPEEDMQVRLIEYSTPKTKKITVERIIKAYPVATVLIMLVFFGVIIGGAVYVIIQKDRSDKNHKFEVEKYRLLSELSEEYLFEYDYKTEILKFDKKFQTTFAFPNTLSCVGSSMKEDALSLFIEQFRSILIGQEAKTFDLIKNGERVCYKIMISTMNNAKGEGVYLVGKMCQVQSENSDNDIFSGNTEKDKITGFYSEKALYHVMPKTVSNTMSFVLDIDNFSNCSKVLGHAGSDYVLELLGEKIMRNLGKNVVVARMHGSKFMGYLENVSEDEANERLRWLVRSMDTMVDFHEEKYPVSITVGATYSEKEVDMNAMIEKATQVFNNQQRIGGNSFIMN